MIEEANFQVYGFDIDLVVKHFIFNKGKLNGNTLTAFSFYRHPCGDRSERLNEMMISLKNTKENRGMVFAQSQNYEVPRGWYLNSFGMSGRQKYFTGFQGGNQISRGERLDLSLWFFSTDLREAEFSDIQYDIGAIGKRKKISPCNETKRKSTLSIPAVSWKDCS